MSQSKQQKQTIVFTTFMVITVLVSAISIGVFFYIFFNGISVLSWGFFTGVPENGMTEGGIFPAIMGTLILIVGSGLVAFPMGILAGIFMNEYAHQNWFKKFVRLMTNNLAGIPSIVFGLFGMAFFVNGLGFGVSILSGCLTLGVLILPIIIRTTEESLKFIPDDYRLASYALGASKWQTIWRVILPAALPNIVTGVILAIGRVAGETAAILFTVAAYFLPKMPTSIYDETMALPYHLYVISTSGTDIEKARPYADGTALTLLMLVFGLNLLANWYRKRLNKKIKV
ncbi:phosphate ABC transporter permease PstA [uncultured Microscilla sp.]|uniref:phosphate ABC transporter permease PstA n=1 Tax=uncultured Microscilla sp. TaxID=432653 RepID=UPI002629D1FF|nr:phosphate ABC transporter permease PstA [uncultured Microscilla sp.]